MNLVLLAAERAFREILERTGPGPPGLDMFSRSYCAGAHTIEFEAWMVGQIEPFRWRLSAAQISQENGWDVETALTSPPDQEFFYLYSELHNRYLSDREERAVRWSSARMIPQQIVVPDPSPELQAQYNDFYSRLIEQTLFNQRIPPADHINAVRFGNPAEVYYPPDRTAEAENKGMLLLWSWLSPEQRTDYERHRHFHVIGGDSGKRYRIAYGTVANIDELDADGDVVCDWCFVPEGDLCPGDVMLAQKIALEIDETAALNVANQNARLTIANNLGLPYRVVA